MEDSKGVLNFDFEGNLNATPSSSFTTTHFGPLVSHNSSVVTYVVSNRGPVTPALSVEDPVGSDNVLEQRSFR